MKGSDLIIGEYYRVKTTSGMNYRSEGRDSRGCTRWLAPGVVLECEGLPATYNPSRHRVISSPGGSNIVIVGDIVTISCHSGLYPNEGGSGASRVNRAKHLRVRIEHELKACLDLSKQIEEKKAKIAKMRTQAEELERFETDEDELAHMLHTLLTRGDQMTPDDIKQLLVARNATNKL